MEKPLRRYLHRFSGTFSVPIPKGPSWKFCVPAALPLLFVFALLFLTGCASHETKTPVAATQHPLFENLPEGFEPKEVGERVAQDFLQRKLDLVNGRIVYPEVCTAFGAVRYAHKAGDRPLQNQLLERYSLLLTPEGSVLISTNRHVDFHVFGILPLEIYQTTGGAAWLDLGLLMANEQWENPLTNGLTSESRWWVDDCFMVCSLQIQTYRATHDIKYANRAATELAAYLDKLQQPNGLFYHGNISPHYWGRGNGWAAVALADVLDALPQDHPLRPRLLTGYVKMMSALKTYQSFSGRWRQLIDMPLSYEESSCTGMFTYALIMGIKHGWIADEQYHNAALKGWIGLCKRIDDAGQVHDVCVGTGQKDDANYYLTRPRVTGDLHGQAPVLWCAWALLDATSTTPKKTAMPSPQTVPAKTDSAPRPRDNPNLFDNPPYLPHGRGF